MKVLGKREGIIFMLEHWQDIFDPDGTTAMALGERTRGGDEGGVPLQPKIARSRWTQELVTCLDALRSFMPNTHSHLKLHYVGVEWRIAYVEAPVMNAHGKPARDKTGRPVTEPKPQRKRVLPSSWSSDDRAAHFRMVNRAVDILCAMYRLPHVRIVDNDELADAAA